MVRIEAMPTRPLAKSVAKVNIVERFQRGKRQEIFFCFVEGLVKRLKLNRLYPASYPNFSRYPGKCK